MTVAVREGLLRVAGSGGGIVRDSDRRLARHVSSGARERSRPPVLVADLAVSRRRSHRARRCRPAVHLGRGARRRRSGGPARHGSAADRGGARLPAPRRARPPRDRRRRGDDRRRRHRARRGAPRGDVVPPTRSRSRPRRRGAHRGTRQLRPLGGQALRRTRPCLGLGRARRSLGAHPRLSAGHAPRRDVRGRPSRGPARFCRPGCSSRPRTRLSSRRSPAGA